MLLQQRRPQLQQLIGAVLEDANDRRPVGDVERDDPGFAVIGAFEFSAVSTSSVAEAGREPEDGLVGDRDPYQMAMTVHMFVSPRIVRSGQVALYIHAGGAATWRCLS